MLTRASRNRIEWQVAWTPGGSHMRHPATAVALDGATAAVAPAAAIATGRATIGILLRPLRAPRFLCAIASHLHPTLPPCAIAIGTAVQAQ